VEVGQQPPEVQGAQVGSVAVLLLREVEAVAGPEVVHPSGNFTSERLAQQDPAVRLETHPLLTTVVEAEVVLVLKQTTLAMPHMEPLVEPVAVVADPITEFAKADPT